MEKTTFRFESDLQFIGRLVGEKTDDVKDERRKNKRVVRVVVKT